MKDKDSMMRFGKSENSPDDTVLEDQYSARSLRDYVQYRDIELKFMKERHAGKIGLLMMAVVAIFVLPLPLVGGLLAAFGPSEQAELYTRIVISMLKEVGQVIAISVLPILGYYFGHYIIKGRDNPEK